MLTIIIPYKGGRIGLATLLILIQPQLAKDDDIYIIDSSPDRSAVGVAKTYGSSRSYIFVETVKDIQLTPGFQSMKENKQNGALVIPPNTIVATTFISNLKNSLPHYKMLMFNEFHSMGGFDPNFKWFTPPPKIINKVPNIMSQVFYISSDRVIRNIPMYNTEEVGYVESEHILLLS